MVRCVWGEAAWGVAWFGRRGKAWTGEVRLGGARVVFGEAWQAGHDWLRQAQVRLGTVRQARSG